MRWLITPLLILGMWSIMTLSLAIPAMAQETSPEITNGLCAGANLNLNDPSCNASNDDAKDKLTKLIRRIINLLSLVVGIVAVIMIIFGGLRYITSGGNDTSVTSAKNTILYAIIGLIIVALAQLIVRFVLRQVSQV